MSQTNNNSCDRAKHDSYLSVKCQNHRKSQDVCPAVAVPSLWSHPLASFILFSSSKVSRAYTAPEENIVLLMKIHANINLFISTVNPELRSPQTAMNKICKYNLN